MAHFEFVGKDHTKRVCSCILDKCSFGCALRRTFENKLTNADRIRAMTDYDLADWIANILMCHGAFARSEDFDFDRYCADCPLDKCCNDQSSDNIEGWLKSPADEVSE